MHDIFSQPAFCSINKLYSYHQIAECGLIIVFSLVLLSTMAGGLGTLQSIPQKERGGGRDQHGFMQLTNHDVITSSNGGPSFELARRRRRDRLWREWDFNRQWPTPREQQQPQLLGLH